jgi:hypothetical protein
MDIGIDPGIAAGVAVGGAGLATVATLDRIIDVTSHDHRSTAYRLAMKPSMKAFKYIGAAGLAIAGVGLLAGFNDGTRKYRDDLLKVAAGIGVGLAIPIVFRLGWGATVAPAHAGWQPGTRALPHFRFGDIAANAVDRVHMMGRDPNLAGRNWKLFNQVSKLQGHGPLLERLDEFAPVLRFEGVNYRTTLANPVPLISDTAEQIASRIIRA